MVTKLAIAAMLAGGMNIILDGVFSIVLYLDKPSYRGKPQTWKKDHSIRLGRITWGAIFFILGMLLLFEV